MKITKYGQSAILIEDYKNKRILIDPGSYCYRETGLTPNDFGKIDILLLTHTHNDHCSPEAIKTIQKNNPEIITLSNAEFKEKLNDFNLDCDVVTPGEIHEIDNIKIKCIKQEHGNLPSGNPKPDNIGFLIDDKIYHTGDTIYMDEKPHAEVLFVPICGTVVMNAKEAAKFAREVGAKLIIPIHYDNPKYPTETESFVKAAEGLNVKVLKFGESIEFQ